MEKIKITPEQARVAVFVFAEHPMNAKGVLKDQLKITDKDFEVYQRLSRSGELEKMVTKTKKKRVTGVKRLRKLGYSVDTQSKNIALTGGGWRRSRKDNRKLKNKTRVYNHGSDV